MKPNIIIQAAYTKGFLKYLNVLGWELKKGRWIFSAPLPVLITTVIFYFQNSQSSFLLDMVESWFFLGCFAILAMVYGLQCFSQEADRKTLDFLLTRPVSLYGIIAIKYLLSAGIFLIWFYLFNIFFSLSVAKMSLPKGLGAEWFYLTLLVVHSSSFFSGIIAKGLERFFAVALITGVVTTAGYQIWSRLFNLISANYYFLDIPLQLKGFISAGLPVFLLIISLALPIIGTIWYLRSRIKIWQFRPAYVIFSLWLLTFLMLFVAEHLFAPPLWPDKLATQGDWHETAGIIYCGYIDPYAKKSDTKPSFLSLTSLGRRATIIHHGLEISHPRFSPNGQYVAFTENGQIMLYNLANRHITSLTRGHIAAWSADNQSLVVAQTIGPQGLSRLFRINVTTQNKTEITGTYHITEMIWDSSTDQLFLLGYNSEVSVLDLKTNNLRTFEYRNNERPRINFGIIKPAFALNSSENSLLFAQSFESELIIYQLNRKTGLLKIYETRTDFRLKTSGMILFHPNLSTFIWPRIDGGYGYLSTKFNLTMQRDVHDESEHEHEHEHE